MAKLATFVVAAVLGVAIGIIGVVATLGAVNPSADTVANETDVDPATVVYGSR